VFYCFFLLSAFVIVSSTNNLANKGCLITTIRYFPLTFIIVLIQQCHALPCYTVMVMIAAAATTNIACRFSEQSAHSVCLSVITRDNDSVCSLQFIADVTHVQLLLLLACYWWWWWTKRVHRPLFLSVICAGRLCDAGWSLACCCWPFTLHCLTASGPTCNTIW